MDNFMHFMEIDTQNVSPSFKTLQLWSEGETRLLLDRYAQYLPDIGPLKTLKNKKDMWVKISTEIEGKSPKPCEDRYKTIIRRKKAAVMNNNATRAKRQKIDFESELDEICKIDDSLAPEIQMSSHKAVVNCKEVVKCETKKKVKSIQATLKEIAHKMRSLLEKILENKSQ